MKAKLFKKKRSLRFTCILATTSIFVIITTSHVAKYIVSLGLDDIAFGWAFAIALDAAIVTCGWLTSKKTKTTGSPQKRQRQHRVGLCGRIISL
jgi:hypothetical protein